MASGGRILSRLDHIAEPERFDRSSGGVVHRVTLRSTGARSRREALVSLWTVEVAARLDDGALIRQRCQCFARPDGASAVLQIDGARVEPDGGARRLARWAEISASADLKSALRVFDPSRLCAPCLAPNFASAEDETQFLKKLSANGAAARRQLYDAVRSIVQNL